MALLGLRKKHIAQLKGFSQPLGYSEENTQGQFSDPTTSPPSWTYELVSQAWSFIYLFIFPDYYLFSTCTPSVIF